MYSQSRVKVLQISDECGFRGVTPFEMRLKSNSGGKTVVVNLLDLPEPNPYRKP